MLSSNFILNFPRNFSNHFDVCRYSNKNLTSFKLLSRQKYRRLKFIFNVVINRRIEDLPSDLAMFDKPNVVRSKWSFVKKVRLSGV